MLGGPLHSATSLAPPLGNGVPPRSDEECQSHSPAPHTCTRKQAGSSSLPPVCLPTRRPPPPAAPQGQEQRAEVKSQANTLLPLPQPCPRHPGDSLGPPSPGRAPLLSAQFLFLFMNRTPPRAGSTLATQFQVSVFEGTRLLGLQEWCGDCAQSARRQALQNEKKATTQADGVL